MNTSVNTTVGARPHSIRGFSLVELLVVAGLLVLLATAAIPSIYNAYTKMTSATSQEVLFQVVNAKNRSIIDQGGPASWDSACGGLEFVRFLLIQPYLSIKGSSPNNATQLVSGLGPSAVLTINVSTVAPTITGLPSY